MTSTTRIQRNYDHRLRELVRSTGDVNYAIQLGVPRSTARGWVNSTPAEVVTLDIVDMDNVRLQQQVLRLCWSSDFDVHGRTVNSARNRNFETGRLIVDRIR